MAWRRWEGRRCGCWALRGEGRRGIEGGGGREGRRGGKEGVDMKNVESDIQRQRRK